MEKVNRKKSNEKSKINIMSIINGILLIMFTISNVLLIINLFKLNDIERLIKNIIVAIIIIMTLLLIVFYVIKFIIKKKTRMTISLIIMSILLPITIFLNYTFIKVYGVFDDIAKNYEEYTLSLVTLSSNSVDSIYDIDDSIGVIADESIENGYTYAKEIVDKNKIEEELLKYETYLNIVEALYNNEIKYAFLPSNYVSMFAVDEKYANISKDIKVLHSDSKKVEVELVNQDVNKPFTILLMGVDTLSSSYNADTLLLVTFNPDTLGATMLSIPRDTYTKIACTGGKHKINSSGWYSDKCVVDTVSNLVDIDIDYYIKINFVGIVDLVNALGGIDVDVPYAFCEQNSKREFGSSTVYVEEGFQHLDGEQALALSRNRHFWHGYCPSKYNEKGYYSNNLRSDITRGLNQQLVIKAILNSLTNVKDLNTIYGLLDVVSDNISKDTILSFYNIFKNIITTSDLSDIENTLDIQRLSLTVYGQYINISGMNLSMIIAHQNSINVVSNAMKENLGLRDKEVIKTFSFNINNLYEETIIGSGIYGGTVVDTLSDMTGDTKEDAESYCTSIGKECEFEFIEVTEDEGYYNNEIIEQSIPANYDISLIYKPIVFKVAKVIDFGNSSFDFSKCIEEDYKNNKNCIVPNFTDKNMTEFNKWYKNFGYIEVKLNKIEDTTKIHNLITNQSIFGKSIYEIYTDKLNIEISYIYNNETVQDKEEDKEIENQDPDKLPDSGDVGQESNPDGKPDEGGNDLDNNQNEGENNPEIPPKDDNTNEEESGSGENVGDSSDEGDEKNTE